MKKKKVKGQILVIILLVISILSIFILAMVSNARKDSQEKRDNKKYEQFYAIGERRLIEAQNVAGIGQLTIDSLRNGMTGYQCDYIVGQEGFKCTKENEDFSAFENNSTDTITTTIYFMDNPELHLSELNSDDSLPIELKKGVNTYTGILKLYYYPTNIEWEITLDYYVQPNLPSDQHGAAYRSFKISTLNRSLPAAIIPASNLPLININGNNFTGISFDINAMMIASGTNANNVVGLRIKPIFGTSNMVSIHIEPSGPGAEDFPAQFRRIISVINSSTLSTSGTDSPTTVLNMEYPISSPVNPLLDYVYRGGKWTQTLANPP